MGSNPLLLEAERFLLEDVRPRAEAIDGDPAQLRWAVNGLCERGLMALKRPEQFGGPAISEEEFRQFQETCARASGALAFLQTQHQSAGSMISKSNNEALKQAYLPLMHDGRKLVGIGFSQLRRPGPPVMRAEPVQGGYLLNGHVPWVTGWDFYSEFLAGATLPDGRAVFAVVPLRTITSPQADTKDLTTLRVSEPMQLAVMQAANTVTVDLESFFVPEEQVAFIQPAGWIQRNDMINVALQGHFAIGCAQAGIDILDQVARKKNLRFLCKAADSLQAELDRCRETTKQAQAQANEETTQERLHVRAWAIDLAVRCAHAAVTASSGAANSVKHPAQRVYREALVFTVSAQTTEIMEATINRLVSRGAPPSDTLS
jgi:alkylation response protein AidB-like acyl-CoA dehydrogenase